MNYPSASYGVSTAVIPEIRLSGIQNSRSTVHFWIPAFAGMTNVASHGVLNPKIKSRREIAGIRNYSISNAMKQFPEAGYLSVNLGKKQGFSHAPCPNPNQVLLNTGQSPSESKSCHATVLQTVSPL